MSFVRLLARDRCWGETVPEPFRPVRSNIKVFSLSEKESSFNPQLPLIISLIDSLHAVQRSSPKFAQAQIVSLNCNNIYDAGCWIKFADQRPQFQLLLIL